MRIKRKEKNLIYSKEAAQKYRAFGDMEFKGDIALFEKLKGVDFRGLNIFYFGCGNGRMEKQLLSFNPKSIVGMEISEPMLSEAKQFLENLPPEQARKVHFKKIEGKTLPYPDNTFDITIVHFVFHYIHDLTPVVRELLRTLKVGGRLFATFNNFSFKPDYEHLENTTLPLVIGKTLKVDVLATTQKRIVNALRDAGFTIDQVDNFDNSSAHIDPSYLQITHVIFENTVLIARK